jgi:hypothetical protein
MTLPIINAPVFTVKLPSTGTPVNFRPFTVKEEKILLMAAASEDAAQIITSLGQIVNNCCFDVNVDDMATFDVEYLFMQIRSKSVGNIIKVTVNDRETPQKAEVDLDNLEVIFPENISNEIKLDDNVTMFMKYPKFKNIDSLGSNETDAPGVAVFRTAVDKLVVNDEVLSFSDYSDSDIESFVDSFTTKNMKDVQDFFGNIPYIKAKAVTLVEKEGDEIREVEIVGLTSFFT